MEITEKTRVIDILDEYGDIADVMSAVGIEPIGKHSLRRIVARFITVGIAARIHRVSPDEFVEKLKAAVINKSEAPVDPVL